MKLHFLTTACLTISAALAQSPTAKVVSPEVGTDGSVSYRLYAPKAAEVKLKTEGPEAIPHATPADVAKSSNAVMAKSTDGVWSIKMGPFPAGAYRYTFTVDGVDTVDPVNPDVSESLNSAKSLVLVPGGYMDLKEVPHGAVETVWYPSTTMHSARRMHIYTPPNYESGKGVYPVLYLLHGGGDNDDAWSSVGRAGFILDNLIASGAAKPMLIVMPAGHVRRNFTLGPNTMRTMGMDEFNDDLVNDVLPYMESHYRVKTDRNSRALAGLSMGGLQTLNVALLHQKLFGYLGVFSSGWFPPAREDFVKDHVTELDSADKNGLHLFWFGVGKEDIAYANCQSTMDLLKQHGFNLEYHETGGFHAWNNWRDYLHEFAQRLF